VGSCRADVAVAGNCGGAEMHAPPPPGQRDALRVRKDEIEEAPQLFPPTIPTYIPTYPHMYISKYQ